MSIRESTLHRKKTSSTELNRWKAIHTHHRHWSGDDACGEQQRDSSQMRAENQAIWCLVPLEA